jgi:hypothetical protein
LQQRCVETRKKRIEKQVKTLFCVLTDALNSLKTQLFHVEQFGKRSCCNNIPEKPAE